MKDDEEIGTMAVGCLWDETSSERSTEEALSVMRERLRNKHALCVEILKDKEVQLRGRMLLACMRPSYDRYVLDIELQNNRRQPGP